MFLKQTNSVPYGKADVAVYFMGGKV